MKNSTFYALLLAVSFVGVYVRILQVAINVQTEYLQDMDGHIDQMNDHILRLERISCKHDYTLGLEAMRERFEDKCGCSP